MKNIEINSELENWKRKVSDAEAECALYRVQIRAERAQTIANKSILESKIKRLENLLLAREKAGISFTGYSQDVLEAVKYAMKHSHPDNGGNAEDFVKFKKCYEEMTKK